MNTEVAKANEENMPVSADFMDEIADSGVLGYSEKQSDALIPILGILQDNSGEVKKKHDRHIEGAQAGDLIVRSLAKIYAGEDGGDDTLLFQPCGFDHVWVEWEGEPGDGAPVRQHAFVEGEVPEGAKEVPDPENPDRTILRMENGNRLVDTRYHYGHILEADALVPCVVPMAGSNHTASRQWTAQMKQFKMPGRNQKMPSFFRMYALETGFVQKGNNSWYKYKISDRGMIGDEETLRAGFEMAKAVAEQRVSADLDSDTVVDGDSSPI